MAEIKKFGRTYSFYNALSINDELMINKLMAHWRFISTDEGYYPSCEVFLADDIVPRLNIAQQPMPSSAAYWAAYYFGHSDLDNLQLSLREWYTKVLIPEFLHKAPPDQRALYKDLTANDIVDFIMVHSLCLHVYKTATPGSKIRGTYLKNNGYGNDAKYLRYLITPFRPTVYDATATSTHGPEYYTGAGELRMAIMPAIISLPDSNNGDKSPIPPLVFINFKISTGSLCATFPFYLSHGVPLLRRLSSIVSDYNANMSIDLGCAPKGSTTLSVTPGLLFRSERAELSGTLARGRKPVIGLRGAQPKLLFDFLAQTLESLPKLRIESRLANSPLARVGYDNNYAYFGGTDSYSDDELLKIVNQTRKLEDYIA